MSLRVIKATIEKVSKKLRLEVDEIIPFISKGELERVKEDRGFVYHYALKEGLRV